VASTSQKQIQGPPKLSTAIKLPTTPSASRRGESGSNVYNIRVGDNVPLKYSHSNVYRAFIAGGIAACGAVTATHPFETVKIRYLPPTLHLLTKALR
jgi:Mitochondrial carrier protein